MIAIVTSINVGIPNVFSYRLVPLTGCVFMEDHSSNSWIVQRDI